MLRQLRMVHHHPARQVANIVVMTTQLLLQLLHIRSQLDKIIEVQQTLSTGNTEKLLAQAAALHPNPAPAAALMATINQQLPYPQSHRRLALLLKAAGYRQDRTSSSRLYWRPNVPGL